MPFKSCSPVQVKLPASHFPFVSVQHSNLHTTAFTLNYFGLGWCISITITVIIIIIIIVAVTVVTLVITCVHVVVVVAFVVVVVLA